ncbi:hypothetical protein ABT131_29035 [Streptomyces sp900105245]|uniref:hypothetical protein n=1 Tax=Streptomyces sp. 900105245 TaxID=3154379 RepID=UPI00332D74D4
MIKVYCLEFACADSPYEQVQATVMSNRLTDEAIAPMRADSICWRSVFQVLKKYLPIRVLHACIHGVFRTHNFEEGNSAHTGSHGSPHARKF